MSEIQVNDRVRHDYSRIKGTVTKIQNDPQGYNYFVVWDYHDSIEDIEDWYKFEVLELL